MHSIGQAPRNLPKEKYARRKEALKRDDRANVARAKEHYCVEPEHSATQSVKELVIHAC